MNEQERAHLNKINGINTEPEMVAVVQKVEETGEVVLILGGKSYKNGDFFTYNGKQYKLEFNINFGGNVVDEIDMSVIERYITTEVYDKVHKTIVTTSIPVYGKKPGRTFYGADVTLSIGGTKIEQEPFYKGMGGRVVCSDDEGTITLDRYAFTIPNTVFGSKPASTPRHHNPDD